MATATELARALAIRMREIDALKDEDRYALLWDAINDEVKALAPELDWTLCLLGSPT